MAASTAQISSPASAARLLTGQVTFGQPGDLAITINRIMDVTEMIVTVLHEPMTRKETTVRRNAHISVTGAAGIRTMLASVDLTQGVQEIRKGVGHTLEDLAF